MSGAESAPSLELGQKEIAKEVNRVMKDLADIVAADITGERGIGKYTGRRPSPTQGEIAQLAFTLYDSRGRQDGHDIEDWLRAEQELVRHYS
jgi:hypothetical protein